MSDSKKRSLFIDDETASHDPTEVTEPSFDDNSTLNFEITQPINLATLKKERRRHPRYTAKMTVAIYSKNAFYRNVTADLSEGGLRLKEDLPAELQGQLLEIILMENDLKALNSYYAFHGVCVAGSRQRLRFNSISERSDAAFFDLLGRLQDLNATAKAL